MKGRTEYFTDLAEECERLAVAEGTTPAEADSHAIVADTLTDNGEHDAD